LLQFQGDEEPAFCSKFGVPYVRAVRMEEGVDLVEYRHRFSGAKALMVDAHVPGQRGGTGQVFDWAKLPSKHPAPAHPFRRPHGRERGARDPRSAALGRGCLQWGGIVTRGEDPRRSSNSFERDVEDAGQSA
jgi:hypothetical protein